MPHIWNWNYCLKAVRLHQPVKSVQTHVICVVKTQKSLVGINSGKTIT